MLRAESDASSSETALETYHGSALRATLSQRTFGSFLEQEWSQETSPGLKILCESLDSLGAQVCVSTWREHTELFRVSSRPSEAGHPHAVPSLRQHLFDTSPTPQGNLTRANLHRTRRGCPDHLKSASSASAESKGPEDVCLDKAWTRRHRRLMHPPSLH